MHKVKNNRWSVTAALAALTLGLTGCAAQAGSRAGGAAGSDVRVLSLAQPNDGIPTEVAAWIDVVMRLSKGTIRIDVKQAWRRGESEAETGIIRDVAGGKVDLAWVGARAFDRVGVTSFQPLLAPMLVDSQALQARVFTEGIAARMLPGVDTADLTGLGVLPGPMRKVLGVQKPFLTPAAFAGQVVGLQDGDVAARTLAALGAKAKNLPSGAKLEGVNAYEQQLASIRGNHYELSARYVGANVNLWPRPMVLFAGRKALRRLSAVQREALRGAGDAALPAAIGAARAEDQDAVPGLCQGGMTFAPATEDGLRALQAAVQPVYEQIRAGRGNREALSKIQELKWALGSGPDTARCAGRPVVHAGASNTPIPDGTYAMTLTAAEEGRCSGDKTAPGGLLELELHKGQVQQYETSGLQPRGLGWIGSYRVFRDRFALTEDVTGHTMSALWTFDGKQLTLTDMRDSECQDRTVWTTHPWVLKRS